MRIQEAMIYTIGTNGKKLPEFLELIKDIDTVLDVIVTSANNATFIYL
jgi:soluble P-type ATPase